MSEQQQDLRTLPEIIAALHKLGGVFTEFADEINASHKDSEQKTRALISDWRKEAERLKRRKIFDGQRSVYVQCANQLETLLLDFSLDKSVEVKP